MSLELAVTTAIALDNLPERACRVCGEVKGPAQFPKNARSRDGLDSRCKACAVAQNARYRAKNAAKNVTQDAAAIANLPERKCTGCGEVKNSAQFPKDASKRDGLRSRCKACNAARTARWRAEHKSDQEYHRKERERNARYREEHREKLREQRARRRAKNVAANAVRDPYADPTPKHCPGCNRDLPRAKFSRNTTRSDGLRDQCRECASRSASDWARNNPEKARAYARRRRALKALVPHIPYDAEPLYSAPCYLCGAPADAVEHFYPLARWWDPRTADAGFNVLPVCTSCNSSKRDRDPLEHWASRGYRPFDRVVFADPREWMSDPDYIVVYDIE
ncbi:hypothetical protein [Actinomadura sp. SCN-SB]|uniref:hypothetical protein n=1 Tax=Actinomadura sp. SCN-SB TaxID=3373092 RepID=UPI00374FE58F